MRERDSEVKAVAAVLRRTNWPLDGHGRYSSIPAREVDDAASRLYSAGLRVLTPLAPEVPPRRDGLALGCWYCGSFIDGHSQECSWALSDGCPVSIDPDNNGHHDACERTLVGGRCDRHGRILAATRTPEPPDSGDGAAPPDGCNCGVDYGAQTCPVHFPAARLRSGSPAPEGGE